MRIFEVKNNLVKIFYEANDNLFLSCFVMIKDSRESYIGQIMHLESSKHGNVAIAKVIFNVTEDGVITAYSGTVPAINSALANINSNDFLKLIQGQNPITIGEFIDKDILVSLDKSLLENKLVICSDSQENSDQIIKTLNRQIKNYDKKTVIIDTHGEETFNKNTFVMGENFRLPINNQLINFIYEKGLEFKSARSKAILQETFIEIQYYLSSLEEPYIPVNRFIDILEKQYKESKMPELVLLKNALIKFDEAGIFARNIMEYKNVFESLIDNQSTVIDVSHVDETIQREVVAYIYSLIKEFPEDYYVFIKPHNGNSDKKLLKQIFSTQNAHTVITCSYSYKYLTELKKISKDLILFTPLIQQQDFASYNTFLNSLGRREFIVYGNATQFVPLIVKLSDRAKIMSVPPKSTISQEDIQKIVQKQLREQQERVQEEERQKEAFIKKQQETEQKFQQQMAQQMACPQPMTQMFYPQQPMYAPTQMYAYNPYMPGFTNPYMPQQPQVMQPFMQQPYMVQTPVPPMAPVQPMTQYAQPIVQTPMAMSQAPQPIQQPQVMQQPIAQTVAPQTAVTPQAPMPQPVQNSAQQTQTEEKIVAPVLKSIEPQEMPIETQTLQEAPKEQDVPAVNNTSRISEAQKAEVPSETPIKEQETPQEKEIQVEVPTNELTEEDLDLIQDTDVYNTTQEFDDLQEPEDDSYLDEIRPDIDDLAKLSQDEAEEEIQEFPEMPQTSSMPEMQEEQVIPAFEEEPAQDIKTQYNITEESLKEPEVVPVYPANTGVNVDTNYEKGDLVVHDTFGNGRIEKIINYGSKKLCSVYFEGVGRRLLDPTLAEFRKVS